MKSVLVHVLLTLVCSSEVGDSPLGWPQFLGPGGLSDAARQNPPLSFDLVRDVRFRVEVPAGSSSPCIVGDRLFLSGFEDGQLLMLAYDRRDGSELWRRQEEPLDQETFDHVDAHPAMPTPCSDGETVYFYFGSFGLIALDLDGRRRWELDLPRTINEFGVGNSPILFEDLLILNRDGCPKGAILALDKADGSLRYRIPRLGVFYSYSSPFLWRNAERSELIIAGTRKLCSYEPRTGKRL